MNTQIHAFVGYRRANIYKTQLENLKIASGGYSPENINFMTYAKLMYSNDTEISELKPDYIVLDEFHRCGAVEWGKRVKRLLVAYSDTPILGLSGTMDESLIKRYGNPYLYK